MSETLDYFERIGSTVDHKWTETGRHAADLSEIAAEGLRDMPVPGTVSPESILSLLTAGTALPKQRPASDQFGQPPVVMYRAEGLEIQAIIWMEGTTSIHQHGFDGAFQILAGSSLHIPYCFDRAETLADGRLLTGRLAMGRPEILRIGDIRTIVSGFGFIHALFHLERPSVTVVVRNSWSDLPYPQYEYRLPGIGADSLYVDPRFDMRMRGLHSLHRIDRDGSLTTALEVVSSQDLWTAFCVCDTWSRGFGDPSGLEDLVQRLGSRSSALGELLEPMYAEDTRRNRILARRGMLREPHHRLFLALIVNLPGRESIRTAIGEAFPEDDPDQLILAWVRELASPQLRGISGLAIDKDALDLLEGNLAAGSDGSGLDLVAERWRPPSLLEKLFV